MLNVKLLANCNRKKYRDLLWTFDAKHSCNMTRHELATLYAHRSDYGEGWLFGYHRPSYCDNVMYESKSQKWYVDVHNHNSNNITIPRG